MARLSEEKAKAIVDDMVSKSGVAQAEALDPLTILAIASLIIQLAKIIYECTHKQALDTLTNPSYIQETRLRWIILRKFAGKSVEFRNAVFAGVKQVGRNSTVDEIISIAQEVG